MKISDNVSRVLADLLKLQAVCSGQVEGSVEDVASRCERSARQLTVADLAVCDGEAREKLQRTAHATAIFLRRTIRRRGMRLTMLRFGQATGFARRGTTV